MSGRARKDTSSTVADRSVHSSGQFEVWQRRISTAFALIGPAVLAAALTTWSRPAGAHVKWFAPYEVGVAPRPIGETLTDPWFCFAIALVLGFFVVTCAVEGTKVGQSLIAGIDRVTGPIWRRADDFVRAMVAAFFVAIFAVGGVYLTPELVTRSEWVAWAQLLIAAGILSRKTAPVSAAGIVALCLIALRDYDLFHLLDYLPLVIGVAAYLVLESSSNPDWRKHRFKILRWTVAIALMWSSLEKFAYPDWFYPLIEEEPAITFGMPRDVYITMAGVTEFTLGFGLIWTPLVWRLSAIALVAVLNVAVFWFGRIEFVGHMLTVAALVTIAADREQTVHFLPALKRPLAGVPVGIASALMIFGAGYWGLHAAIYGPEGRVVSNGEMASQSEPRPTRP